MRLLPQNPKNSVKGSFVGMTPSELRRFADRAESELKDVTNVAIEVTDGIVFYFEKDRTEHEAFESPAAHA